ncbi:hypothetical protein K5X82_11025 [Halosquirtibacter xylanolyticus]|uniref:hypothetical protein n=1 Tax=Halosquirtibacter xylanolyticus TaxID=3374599 RepID=UPI003749DB7A|nr:hypothetical protein K5X82_11025 [Prolixibacteraceae bacterium]
MAELNFENLLRAKAKGFNAPVSSTVTKSIMKQTTGSVKSALSTKTLSSTIKKGLVKIGTLGTKNIIVGAAISTGTTAVVATSSYLASTSHQSEVLNNIDRHIIQDSIVNKVSLMEEIHLDTNTSTIAPQQKAGIQQHTQKTKLDNKVIHFLDAVQLQKSEIKDSVQSKDTYSTNNFSEYPSHTEVLTTKELPNTISHRDIELTSSSPKDAICFDLPSSSQTNTQTETLDEQKHRNKKIKVRLSTSYGISKLLISGDKSDKTTSNPWGHNYDLTVDIGYKLSKKIDFISSFKYQNLTLNSNLGSYETKEEYINRDITMLHGRVGINYLIIQSPKWYIDIHGNIGLGYKLKHDTKMSLRYLDEPITLDHTKEQPWSPSMSLGSTFFYNVNKTITMGLSLNGEYEQILEQYHVININSALSVCFKF